MLVVEDDLSIRNVLEDALVDRGFRVVTADNGADAIERLEFVQPDVVLLDLLMPVMNGWDFMESYAGKTGGKALPIVVVTVNPALPRSFNGFGVRQVVAKPFKIDELIEAIEGALQPVPAGTL